jgi:para-nitrobenzyl esterase
MIRRRGQIIAALCFAILIAAPSHAQAVAKAIRGDPVVTDAGNIAGIELASGVRAYLGVPFAAPPVRELRWRPPQPMTAWKGTYHADRAAPECIQTLRPHDINHYFGEEATSEDCLYLNIWAPPREAGVRPVPVVVWIYGGGFTIGSASMANYSGEKLAAKGVVYVALAYRVGALGFLAHPELSAESPNRASGNYGFLDQIAALQWIQHNIAHFGGDPRNVTIMGQSAGSASVSVLQVSPLSRGLFHRAVGMSGSAFGASTPRARSLRAGEEWGRELQTLLKAPSLEAMRQLPADRILAVQGATGTYGPVVDGWLLPDEPSAIFSAGKQNDVPIMIGYTRDEGFSPFNRVMSLADYREQVRAYGEHASELRRLYPADSDVKARRAALDIGRDATLGLQMRSWARAQTRSGKEPAYLYFFTRVHPYVPGVKFSDHDPTTVGSYHSADIPYWLQTLDSLNLFRATREWTAYDRELAERMSDAIVSFARTGAPALGGGVDWPAYRSEDEQIVELGDAVRVIELPNSAKMDFLARHTPQEPVREEGEYEPAISAWPVLEDRYPERRAAFRSGVTGIADVTYSVVSGFRPLTLDLYLPPKRADRGSPLIVYVHGGGWMSGHTRHSGAFENWPEVLASIASRGYVVASLNYRLSAEASSPAAGHDVKFAVRWLRANAGRYGINKQHVGIWGGSAGGQLAGLAGTSCGVEALAPEVADTNVRAQSDCVQAVVAWYGVFDFSPLVQPGVGATPATRYLGCESNECSDGAVSLASPIRHVDRTDPPFLLIHGALDKTVAVSQSQRFHAVLLAHGVKSQLLILPDVDHSFVGSSTERTRDASLRALRATIEFFDQTLR